MDDLKIEELARKYPDIFEKSGDFELSVGDGWYVIIDKLLYLISYDVEYNRRLLKYALENPDGKYVKSIGELEDSLRNSLEQLPVIDQVKQKFGGLRFYVSGGSKKVDNYITFAECMSVSTCEVCGAPGQRRNNGWITVLCDTHDREANSDRDQKVSRGAGPDSDEE